MIARTFETIQEEYSSCINLVSELSAELKKTKRKDKLSDGSFIIKDRIKKIRVFNGECCECNDIFKISINSLNNLKKKNIQYKCFSCANKKGARNVSKF